MDRYSQNDEQDVILRELTGSGITGRFLDIGAYDGKTLSNTYTLSLLGWKGVCIEPSPKNFERLDIVHSNNPDVHCIPVAIGNISGKTIFHDTPGDFYGSLSQGNGKRYNRTEIPIEVYCWTMDELLEREGNDFDFISLDVEGNNFEVLKSIPFDKLSKLRLICVEYDGQAEAMTKYLEPFGFQLIHRTGENIILKRSL